MKILIDLYKKNYIRKFEIEGNDLILIKVEEEPKTDIWNYHYIFRSKEISSNKSIVVKENGILPLDIAINPYDNTISYIKFFIINNEIKTSYTGNNFTYIKNNIKVINEKLDIDHMYMEIERKFDYIINDNELLVISSSLGKKIIAYEIVEDNYILFEGEEFCGVLFKNLSNKEVKALKQVSIL